MSVLPLQDWIAVALLAAFVAGLYFGPSLWVTFTQSPSDATRIKVQYEGLDSPAGPYSKVLGIERKGTLIGGRPGSPSSRKYEVRLEKADGHVLTKVVQVEASPFGQGRITEGS